MAYLIFIGENVKTVVPSWSSKGIVMACIPGLSGLVLFRQLSKLSPFALVADFANMLGIMVVMSNDLELFREHEVTSEDHTLDYLLYGIRVGQIPYFFGIVMYCYEGVGVILNIHESMENKENFNKVLSVTMVAVTIMYLLFGSLGYIAYGKETNEIITLNLGDGLPSDVVKLALSTGLFFTFPLMMFPVFSVMENSSFMDTQSFAAKNFIRIATVLFAVFVALGIPNFGDFISLVGAGACAALAMILPAYVHLKLAPYMTDPEVFVNNILFFSGILFAVVGTYHAAESMHSKS